MPNSENKINRTSYDLHFIKSAFEKDQDLSYKVFKQMPIGICVTNEQGYFTDVNDAYCDLYGYERENLIGKEFTSVVPDDQKDTLDQLHKDFIDKKFELRGRWTVVDRQGNEFDIVTNAAYLQGELYERPHKMTLVVRAEEIDDTLEKLKSTIAILESKINAQENARAMAEHDMRNNIGSILSIASILENSNPNEMQLKWLKMITSIGNDTLELLEASKGFAKMELGTYKPEMNSFDLFNMIKEEVQDSIKNHAKKIEVSYRHNNTEIDIENEELIIKADDFYIKRLLRNIISNAIEASEAGGVIQITVNTEMRLVLEIRNSGMVPEKLKENFFDKYTTHGKEKGTGLGTYIAKLITESHGGNISFTTSEDMGTSVIVDLPHELLEID